MQNHLYPGMFSGCLSEWKRRRYAWLSAIDRTVFAEVGSTEWQYTQQELL